MDCYEHKQYEFRRFPASAADRSPWNTDRSAVERGQLHWWYARVCGTALSLPLISHSIFPTPFEEGENQTTACASLLLSCAVSQCSTTITHTHQHSYRSLPREWMCRAAPFTGLLSRRRVERVGRVVWCVVVVGRGRD